MYKLTTRIATLVLVLLTVPIGHAKETPEFDVVITNGRVIDPETGLDGIRHLGISDGSIVSISETPLTGARTIDASGMVVAPGFIDLHAHGQNIGDYRMQAAQGVTTMLELESGILPVAQWYEDQASKNLPINYGAASGWTFARIATFSGEGPEASTEYFQQAQGRNDWKMEIATPEQQATILDMVAQGLDEGALGIGINAGYAPGYGTKEYTALAQLAADQEVATFTHVRYASNMEPASSYQAIQELIANAAITGAHMHLCHLNSTSLKDINDTLQLINAAFEQDINISVGAYPWGAASTVVGAAMFSGDGWRERMGSTADNFQLGPNRMTEEQLTDYQKNKPGTIITWHFLDESNPEDLSMLDASILHPRILIESDEMFWMLIDEKGIENYAGDDWPLPEKAFSHPRSNGTFAKVLRSYVRERKLMTLSEAIRKMSLMPAQTMEDFVPQMKKKGRLQLGMDADIVVFDPNTVREVGTYEDPNHPAQGINWVLVNGTLVVDKGELILNAGPGRPIRRSIH